jgi:DNA repair protein SbcC/Rad50
MLAIDEGFGSQDREGCDRLIEAIRMVQDDFERILVITHMEEIKDAFPVRIEVTKTAEGSTFSIT